MTERRGCLRSQRGSSLLEILIALPLLTMLLLSLGTAFLFVLRIYTAELGNRELQAQVRLVAEDLITDIEYADRIEILANGLRIWTQRRSAGRRCFDYQLRNSRGIGEITKDLQPLTGDSIYGDIRIIRFSCSKPNERTVWIEIEAENKTTGKKLSVATGAALRNGQPEKLWKAGDGHE